MSGWTWVLSVIFNICHVCQKTVGTELTSLRWPVAREFHSELNCESSGWFFTSDASDFCADQDVLQRQIDYLYTVYKFTFTFALRLNYYNQSYII